MEFTADLIAVQGLLTSAVKVTGAFSDLRYRGGNEEKLLYIIKEIEVYLSSKSYLNKRKINIKYENKVRDIVFYLIVNTEFDDPYYKNNEEISHVTNTIPQLSKCVLIHIIVELGLTEVCPKILNSSSPKIVLEITDELFSCLKHAKPQQSLYSTVHFLELIILRLSVLEEKQNEDIIEKLNDIGIELASKLGKINPEAIQGWKTEKLYTHMGYSLINLLKLLMIHDEKSTNSRKLLDGIILATMSIFRAVSVHVFCIWAETIYEGQPLQIAIASEAYRIMGKYQNYKPANELVQMLSSVAQRPKSLNEIIHEADVETMIDSIKSSDSNPDIQKRWFIALINTNVFANKEATKCLKEYSHLCEEGDVSRILDLCMNHLDADTKKIALECSGHLNSSSLNLIMTRFFYGHGLMPHLCIIDNVEESLIKLLNNLQKEEQKQKDFVKDVQMIMLQDPQETLRILINECLKKSVYIPCLKETFRCIKSVAEVDLIWFKIFSEALKNSKLSWDNLSSYVGFVNMIIELEYISFLKFSEEALVPLMNSSMETDDFEQLLITLHFLNDIKGIDGRGVKLFTSLLNSLNKTRCKLLEFSYVKQECAKKTVEILNKIRNQSRVIANMVNVEGLEKINRYYLESLTAENEVDLLHFIFPNIETPDILARLIQLLPRCVETEWLSIFRSLQSQQGIEKATDTLTNFVLLLCELVSSQSDRESEQSQKYINGLKYCITHYAITIKKYLFSIDDVDAEKMGAKCMCQLIKYIPNEIKEEEGLKLAAILTDRALQQLANDETFVSLLVAIRNPKISQVIAKRMLA